MDGFVNFFDGSFAYEAYIFERKKRNKQFLVFFFSSPESGRFAVNNFDAIYLKR